MLHLQTENTSTPEGWAKLEHAESGEAPNIMDEGELPVDADGNYVAGVPVDPNDPRTQNMKPAGQTSPPARSAVSVLKRTHSAFLQSCHCDPLQLYRPVGLLLQSASVHVMCTV